MATRQVTKSAGAVGPGTWRAVVGGICVAALLGGLALSIAGGTSHSAIPASVNQTRRSSRAGTQSYVFGPEAGVANVDNAPVTFAPASSQKQNQVPRLQSHAGTNSSSLPSNIIQTANLTLKVGHKQAFRATRRAVDIAQGLHGYVAYRDSLNHDSTVNLQVRVPASSFLFALKQLRSLGQVKVEDDSTQDVGLQVVDLSARLKNLETQRDQLLRLFGKAKSVADTIRIERVLSNVQGEVEQTQARMRYLNNQTQLGTISLTIQARTFKHHKPRLTSANAIGNAFGTAGNGIVNVVAGAIVTVGYALPLAFFMFVGYGLFLLGRRIYRRRGNQETGIAPSVA